MRSTWLAIALTVFAPLAGAQFKWVEASGLVGYGDKPPPGAHDIEPLQDVVKGGPRDPLATLPYQLQRTIKDFPVTLYTTSDCPGCDHGRSLLKGRAVPFTERTIRTADDVQALKQLANSDQLPVFRVGGRTVTGFNSATWDEMLDLAGYPRGGQLPADWAWPAPAPLAEPKPAQAASTETATPPDPGSPR
ncbi:MAG TPA: glutaredoxin family protein [Burkholderiaceae bacterium]|jgi:glutaredoxin|nr:glutaredoxin family protein [Burkholderiaceae bacterium]